LTLLDSGSELGKAMYCLINIALMGMAVLRGSLPQWLRMALPALRN